MVSAPEARRSFRRMTLTELEPCLSIHICPPPAPQQSVRSPDSGGGLEDGTDGVEHAAGLCDDAVDAREVAGIVVDRTEPFGLDVRKTACLHEFVNENSVTDHGPAEVLEGRIFILERIEAVGAGRQDAVEVILGEVSDVFLSSGLVEVFLAESAGELAVAALFGHDGEVDPCGLENPHHAACDLASAAVVAGGAATQ